MIQKKVKAKYNVTEKRNKRKNKINVNMKLQRNNNLKKLRSEKVYETEHGIDIKQNIK